MDPTSNVTSPVRTGAADGPPVGAAPVGESADGPPVGARPPSSRRCTNSRRISIPNQRLIRQWLTTRPPPPAPPPAPKPLIIHSNTNGRSAKKKIQERKIVIAKKNGRNQEQSYLGAAAVACEKCKKAIGKSKSLCVAYESLRASQEDFFKNRDEIIDEGFDKLEDLDLISEKEG